MPQAPPPLRFEPLNSCIYCGYIGTDLTDEHIIPYGLGGDLILPKSSCKPCASITGAKIEGTVLRKMLINLRTKYMIRTRNPKDRPVDYQIKIYNPDGSFDYKTLLSKDLSISSWALPVYNYPTYTAQFHSEPALKKIQCMISTYDANMFVSHSNQGEPVGVEISINVRFFSRMLAKIALSFAIATLGPGAILSPLLKKIVLGECDDTEFLVGSFDELKPPSDYLYEIGFQSFLAGNGLETVAVVIRLFCHLGTPTYIVALGSRQEITGKFESIPIYATGINTTIRDPKTNKVIPLGNFLRYEVQLDVSVLNDVSHAELRVVPDKARFLGKTKKGRARRPLN